MPNFITFLQSVLWAVWGTVWSKDKGTPTFAKENMGLYLNQQIKKLKVVTTKSNKQRNKIQQRQADRLQLNIQMNKEDNLRRKELAHYNTKGKNNYTLHKTHNCHSVWLLCPGLATGCRFPFSLLHVMNYFPWSLCCVPGRFLSP